MVVFLHANFKSNDFVSSLTRSYLKQKSSLPIYTGLLNASLPDDFLFILCVILALLICMENTFWNISMDVNFVDLFKTSFALYVESGTRKKVETAINVLRNDLEQGRCLVTEDFKEKFCKIIIEHYLRKFHCLPVYFTQHI